MLEKLGSYSASTASYNAAIDNKSLERTKCSPGTREEILATIQDWIDNDDEQVFWLTGHAGSGKSTIAYTVAANATSDSALVTYFCSRQLDSGESKRLVPTLCRTLAYRDAEFAHQLAAVLDENDEVLSGRVGYQTRRLLTEPWSHRAAKTETSILVVVDALDENTAGYAFLEALLDGAGAGELPGLKFLITSRTQEDIAAKCERYPMCRLQDVPVEHATRDIGRYLKNVLSGCDSESLDRVAGMSGGLFIYAATVVREVAPDGRTTRVDTKKRLLRNFLIASESASFLGGLYGFYTEIIRNWLNRCSERDRKTWENTLHTIVYAKEPVSAATLALLVAPDWSDKEIVDIVNHLHAVLYINNNLVCWYHASFQDFLLDTTNFYACIPSNQHMFLATACLHIMMREDLENPLHFNMGGLTSSYLLDSEDPELSARVTTKFKNTALGYVCHYWTAHIANLDIAVNTKTTLLQHLLKFLRSERVLFWFEAMSLMGLARECRLMIKSLHNWTIKVGLLLNRHTHLLTPSIVWFCKS